MAAVDEFQAVAVAKPFNQPTTYFLADVTVN